MTAEAIGPLYQRIADDIRSKIGSGEYPVGGEVPSTAVMADTYDVSRTVVRQALDVLKNEGILVGHPGKAVYVRATPAQAAKDRQDAGVLAGQVEELRGMVDRLAARVGDLPAEVRDTLARFELHLTRVEANLADLYARQGFDYPRDEDQHDGDGMAHGNRDLA